MTQKVGGNTRGLSPSLLRMVHKISTRRCEASEIVPLDLAREIHQVAQTISRRIGVLISREGRIEEVFIGSRDILYLPDLGRYRLGTGRLRRLRLIFSDLSSAPEPQIPADIMTDLEKLRLDMVVGVKVSRGKTGMSYAHLVPNHPEDNGLVPGTRKEMVDDIGRFELDFQEFMDGLETELSGQEASSPIPAGQMGAVLISVSDRPADEVRSSLDELEELARTAGVYVMERIVQRKRPDPKSVLGKGKLEEVVLRCLRLGAEMIIFDTELKPGQWRVITNSTELKVLDRSMLILDIFAQRAQSSEGRLQVELAQLKYNMPRLVEKDAGLSRLSGGIGGRGPGETKLELGRRALRDRIADLEGRIRDVSKHRTVRRSRRVQNELPLVVIVGYTNVGKSTLFNVLTGSSVIAENKLFATLDPYQRRVVLPDQETGENFEFVLSDTVGFIRDLPDELMTAFRATLEELIDAALLVHVIDATDPYALERKENVEKIIDELELGEFQHLVVINKVDAAQPDDVEAMVNATGGIPVSAEKRENLDALLQEIKRLLVMTPLQRSSEESELRY